MSKTIMSSNQRQVIHLYIKASSEHHYFGSIPAMYDNFSPDQLGVAQQSLYNRWKEGIWENEKVVIRKGRLVVTNKHKKNE